jgi:regulatory protein
MPDKTFLKVILNKAMALCSGKEYCVEDIRNKLSSWGVEDKDAGNILETLIKENFINETRYANAFAGDKFRYNKWGKLKIAAHLRAKKLPAEIINAALDSIDNEEYRRLVQSILDTHRKSVKAKNQYDMKAKLLRFGLSKGFESSLLYDMLNDMED